MMMTTKGKRLERYQTVTPAAAEYTLAIRQLSFWKIKKGYSKSKSKKLIESNSNLNYYLRTCSCFHFKSGESPDVSRTSKSCFSASTPNTPSGSLRRNFLTTDEIVWTLKLAIFTNLPVCKKWINFFILAWCPGARNTSRLFGPSLFSFRIRTCNVIEQFQCNFCFAIIALVIKIYQQRPGNVWFTYLIKWNSKLDSDEENIIK